MQLFTLIITILISISAVGFSDVKSKYGNISFDASRDGNAEMYLDSTGLGIGITSPSANLHVAGNAIVTGDLLIGASSGGNSTLHIEGAIGFNIQSVSSNTTLSGNSVVLVDTSNGNITLSLPNASEVIGRVYHIKKMTSSNNLYLTGGLIDNNTDIPLENASTSFPFISVISIGGNSWYITSLSGNGAIVSSDNLIGWWRFEESSGITANDSSNNNNTGTLNGSMTFSGNGVLGKIGNALVFDGTNDKITILDSSILNMGNVLTLSCWINTSQNVSGTTEARIIQKGLSSQNTCSYGMDISDITGADHAHFYIDKNDNDNSGALSSTTVVNDGMWHHIAGSWDGATIKIFVDGEMENSKNYSSAMNTVTDPVTIGGRDDGSGDWFNGMIDDIRIYNKALTTVEIQMLYQIGQ